MHGGTAVFVVNMCFNFGLSEGEIRRFVEIGDCGIGSAGNLSWAIWGFDGGCGIRISDLFFELGALLRFFRLCQR